MKNKELSEKLEDMDQKMTILRDKAYNVEKEKE